MQAIKKWPFLAATFTVPALFIAGCSGGGNNSVFNPNPSPNNVPSTQIFGLTNDNRLVSFNAQTPFTTTLLTVSGIPAGQQLLGIDFRFAPDAAGTPGLYGLAGNGGNFQLYRFATTNAAATATAVGSPFAIPVSTDIGLDFNPNVPSPADPTIRLDRLRVVTGNRTNLRLVPNTGAVVDSDAVAAGIQLDGTLTYAAGDSNAGSTPRIVGAAYTNNDTDIATGTVNYAIDAANGLLVTQGRPAGAGGNPAAVSPNTGQLFTVGSLGVGVTNNVGFDIAPTNNLAFLSSGNNFFSVNLATGATSSLGTITVPGNRTLRGLAVSP